MQQKEKGRFMSQRKTAQQSSAMGKSLPTKNNNGGMMSKVEA